MTFSEIAAGKMNTASFFLSFFPPLFLLNLLVLFGLLSLPHNQKMFEGKADTFIDRLEPQIIAGKC